MRACARAARLWAYRSPELGLSCLAIARQLPLRPARGAEKLTEPNPHYRQGKNKPKG